MKLSMENLLKRHHQVLKLLKLTQNLNRFSVFKSYFLNIGSLNVSWNMRTVHTVISDRINQHYLLVFLGFHVHLFYVLSNLLHFNVKLIRHADIFNYRNHVANKDRFILIGHLYNKKKLFWPDMPRIFMIHT